MSTKRTSKLVALLLSLVMAVCIMPTTAFAVETVESVSATVTAPVAGANPLSTATSGDTDKYTASVTFAEGTGFPPASESLSDSQEFEAGKSYIALVVFTAEDGYDFVDTTTATINGHPATFYQRESGIIGFYVVFNASSTDPEDPGVLVESVSATVTAPVAGANPLSTATSGDTDKYTASVTFAEGTGFPPASESLSDSQEFEAGKSYIGLVAFTAEEGYKFDDTTTATINGHPATFYHREGRIIGFYVVFNLSAAPTELTSVSATVTAPAADASPATTATVATADNDKYTVSVYGWFKGGSTGTPGTEMGASEVFEAGQTYIVELTFTPKTGYSFSDAATATINSMSGDLFGSNTITGAHSYRVAFTVPAASSAELTAVSATVTAPVAGASPATTATVPVADNDKYTVSVSCWNEGGTVWVPGDLMGVSDTFEAGETYIVELTFTPKTGYSFSDSATATINTMSGHASGTNTITGARSYRVALTVPAAPAGFNVDFLSTFYVPAGTVGTAIDPINIASGVTGGVTPYTYALANNPAWLSISAAGVITGTRPAEATGATTAKVRISDASTPEELRTITIDVGAVTVAPTELTFADSTAYDIPAGAVGVSYTVATAFTATDGTAPYAFLLATTVPGLSINNDNKLEYSRPAVTAATTATIQVTDGASATKTITISIGAVTAPDPAYQVIQGANGAWKKGSSSGLTVTSDAPFASFTSVEVDGVTIAASNYTAAEGSTVVTLQANYLETLSAGVHTLSIVSGAEKATTQFTVATPSTVPNTGVSSMSLWVALLFVAGAGMAGAIVYSRKMRRAE